MKRFASPVAAVCAAGALSLAIVAHAEAPAAAQAAAIGYAKRFMSIS